LYIIIQAVDAILKTQYKANLSHMGQVARIKRDDDDDDDVVHTVIFFTVYENFRVSTLCA